MVRGDLGSIPDRVIPKTLKMVLDISLLNTQKDAPPWGLSTLAKEFSAAARINAKVFERIEHSGS